MYLEQSVKIMDDTLNLQSNNQSFSRYWLAFKMVANSNKHGVILFNSMDEALSFQTRADWRGWLSKNHAITTSVWLFFFKKSTGKKGITIEDAVEEAICFGWIDGKLKRVDEERFMLRFSVRKDGSVWSRINRLRAEKLITDGKMTSAGLAKIEQAKISGYWDMAYTNKIKDELPADLLEALKKDIKAINNFKLFANTYQNMYIGWVNSAKSFETRKKRIDKVVEQARINKKLIFQ
jgi:uncharacterized protein YdeI (YjbR/CyaY-like superfamily)